MSADRTERVLAELAARRRFGMKPGLDAVSAVLARLGDPHRRLRAVHVAGTNGKGAVTALLAAALPGRVARYTSPHLVRLNERFVLDGRPLPDEVLAPAAEAVLAASADIPDLTFFEALTAVAFRVFADAEADWAVLETGLGGRLDATNVCRSALSVITRIGLDHCDWLGHTLAEIAAEKGGIVKPGVPVVVGRNAAEALDVLRRIAAEKGAPFHYAPDLADEADIPPDFPLAGPFNRENAVTAIAALRVLGRPAANFGRVVWPGRFQTVGDFIVDGAHNPPAAAALAAALGERFPGGERLSLVAGFCGDKDADTVLRTLAPRVARAWAVRTANPRSLPAEETAAKMREAGIDGAVAAPSLAAALEAARAAGGHALVCGSLFLAGEALVALGAYPWPSDRTDPSELLKGDGA